MPDAEKDKLMETLIDFAEWLGHDAEEAQVAADSYLRESAESPLSPATTAIVTRPLRPDLGDDPDGDLDEIWGHCCCPCRWLWIPDDPRPSARSAQG